MFKKNHLGEITIITGPMFAGKTLELIRIIDQLDYSKKKYIVVKPTIDTSTNSSIKSRWTKEKAAHSFENSEKLLNFVENSKIDYYAIVLDEIQFFDNNLHFVLDKLADKGINIIASGLDRDFRGIPFEVTANVLAISENIIKLHAICSVCGEAAYMSQKIVNKIPITSDTKIIDIKNNIDYTPVCRKHFVRKYGKIK